jgi:hypothetical protein
MTDPLISKSQAIEALEKIGCQKCVSGQGDAGFCICGGGPAIYLDPILDLIRALPVVSSPVTLTRETLDELRYQVAVSHESPEGMNPWDAMGALIDAILEPSAPPVGTQE